MLATEHCGKLNMNACGFGICHASALLMVRLGVTSHIYRCLTVPRRAQSDTDTPHDAVQAPWGLQSDWASARQLQGSSVSHALLWPSHRDAVLTGSSASVRCRGVPCIYLLAAFFKDHKIESEILIKYDFFFEDIQIIKSSR